MTYLDRLASRIRAALPPTISVPENTNSLFLIYAVLARSKGDSVTASDVHDAWSAWMTTQDREHPALVEYGLLPDDVQAKDAPFLAAIRQVARDKAMIVYAVTVPPENVERLFTTQEAAEAFIDSDSVWGRVGAYVRTVTVES